MLESSFLETTAEIAIAFGGFISIFLVLATRDGRFPPQDANPIRVLVICSVAPVFYSSLPLLLHSLGLSEPALWRFSSGISLVAMALIWVFMVFKGLDYSDSDRSATIVSLTLIDVGLGVLSLLCLFANALAWPWLPSGGMHLLAIWSIVTLAGIHFVVLVFSRVL